MSVNFDPMLFGRSATAVMRERLFALATQLSDIIGKNAPVAFGTLSGSFVAMDMPTAIGVNVQIVSPLWFKPTGYGAYVEFGSKPHWVPIQPLINYVWQKYGGATGVKKMFKAGQLKKEMSIGFGFEGKKKFRPKKFDADREIRNIAYAIRYKIAMKGTIGQFYVERAIQSLGLQYQVVSDATDVCYVINIAEYLASLNLLPEICQRAVA